MEVYNETTKQNIQIAFELIVPFTLTAMKGMTRFPGLFDRLNDKSYMRILIQRATGNIGSEVVKEALSKAYQINLLLRKKSQPIHLTQRFYWKCKQKRCNCL